MGGDHNLLLEFEFSCLGNILEGGREERDWRGGYERDTWRGGYQREEQDCRGSDERRELNRRGCDEKGDWGKAKGGGGDEKEEWERKGR